MEQAKQLNELQKKREIDPSLEIVVGLSWDVIEGQEIDLDLQCVLLNELSQIEDAVFYNQREAKTGKISLSEDSLGEKVGFDETMNISLSTIPFNIKYLVILVCSFKGQPLKNVETSKVTVLQNQLVLQEWGCSGNAGGVNKSAVPCFFERQFDGKWVMHTIEELGEGKNFDECEGLIKQGLIKGGFDEMLFLECKNWKGNKTFTLSKNQALPIPDSLKQIHVGLGWDTRCDIDSSILAFDSLNNCVETIFFGKQSNNSNSIVHHGDNLTGVGDGDDEIITIDLQKLPENIKTLWAVITVFTTRKTFQDVSGAFCRLFSKQTKQEFCKYNLSSCEDKLSNGNIMCCISRCQKSQWTVSPKGFYSKNTIVASQVIPIVQKILQNDFSQITISNKTYCLPKTFSIEIEKATGLGAFDSNGFSDPYVELHINQSKICKTPRINKTLNPVWNFKCDKKLNSGDQIEFRIFDHDFLVSDDYMGSSYFTVGADLSSKGVEQVQMEVLDKQKQKSNIYIGTLFVNFKSV